MGKLIGYARVSTRQQDADRQASDLLNAGVRRDDLYADHGVSGGRGSRPAFDKAVNARAAGKDLGGRRRTFTDSQIRNAPRLIDGGESATQVARDIGMSRATLYRRIRELPVSFA